MKHITLNSYKQFCDIVLEEDTINEIPPNHSIVHVPTHLMRKFCENIIETNNKYVVVSSANDYGPAYQTDFPVYLDFIRNIYTLDLKQANYKTIQIDPRCNISQCYPDDQIAVRCFAFTECTLPCIPDNIVRWFTCNNQTKDPKITSIPLGIQDDMPKDIIILSNTDYYADKLYVNFEDTTINRVWYKQHFKYGKFDKVTLLNNRNRQEYLEDLNSHKCIFCPPGNGVDTHRLWETIYLKRLPVLINNKFSQLIHYSYPSILVNHVSEIQLDNIWKDNTIGSYYEFYDLDYWQNKIKEARNDTY